MSKRIIQILLIFAIIILTILLGIIIGTNIVDKYNNKKLVDNTYKTITNEKNQEKTIKEKYNNNDILGIIKIVDINFEGVIYEGTTQDILKKGVGHFEETPIIDGNICLAAHNTNKFWAKLKNVKNGSKIIYTSRFGEREYKVFSSRQIEETDLSPLKNTEENIITLITCVKGQKNKRLCIQAIEI